MAELVRAVPPFQQMVCVRLANSLIAGLPGVMGTPQKAILRFFSPFANSSVDQSEPAYTAILSGDISPDMIALHSTSPYTAPYTRPGLHILHMS
jgi:hypothetical protein